MAWTSVTVGELNLGCSLLRPGEPLHTALRCLWPNYLHHPCDAKPHVPTACRLLCQRALRLYHKQTHQRWAMRCLDDLHQLADAQIIFFVKQLSPSDAACSKQIKLPKPEAKRFIGELRHKQSTIVVS